MTRRRSFADTLSALVALVALVIVVLAMAYIPLAGVVPTIRRLLDGELVDAALVVFLSILYLTAFTLGDTYP